MDEVVTSDEPGVRVHLPRMSDPHLKLAKHQARHSETGRKGRLMTASTMLRTDEEIQRDEIGVMVTNGVTLTGWVDSYREEPVALGIATNLGAEHLAEQTVAARSVCSRGRRGCTFACA
jgi:hypothetical protein